MATQLINKADVFAMYQSTEYTDTTQLIVELTPVSIEKTANKMVWVDNNPLTYTILIKNKDVESSGNSLTNVKFEDLIDPQIAELDTNNVFVNEIHQTLGTDFEYDVNTGVLSFDPLADIEAGATMTITFQVTKKVQP